MVNVVLGLYESCPLPPLRAAAVARAYKLIVLEDENTGYQTLGPVSKMFNLVARAYHEGPESEAYRLHKSKRDDFMWMGSEGMMMCGTNGSQLWDIGFITQALVETGLADLPENKESLIKALEWLEDGQILDHPKHYKTSYRHGTKGAWGFRWVRSHLYDTLRASDIFQHEGARICGQRLYWGGSKGGSLFTEGPQVCSPLLTPSLIR
jgi:lanosterol synthase